MSSCKSASRLSACVAVCSRAFEAHEGWFAVIDFCLGSVMGADFDVEAAHNLNSIGLSAFAGKHGDYSDGLSRKH